MLLAKIYHPSVDVDDYWISEKYDGVRAYWNGHHLISRQGNTYHAPDWFTAKFPANPLDGELWISRGRFEQLISTVRKHNPVDSEWRQVRYMVFELPGGEGDFDQRLQTLQSLLDPSPSRYLRLVPQFRVRNHAELKQRLDQIVADGGEGLMLHRADAPYHGGRSRDLLKLKPWLDAEAKVIAHLPGKGKYEGMLGALLVETEDHRKFRIGTGFSDAERRTPPPVGAIVTYRYNGVSANGIPRSASFQRIRELEDEGSAISAPTTSRR